MFSFLFIYLFLNLRFITHTVVAQSTKGPAVAHLGHTSHSVFVCIDRLNLGWPTPEFSLVGDTLVGRVAETSPILETKRSHSAACGWVQRLVCALPIWEKKENSAVPTYLQGLQGDFQIPFSMCFSKVFFVPLPRICISLGSVSQNFI